MNLFDKYALGHDYQTFIAKYANDVQKERWKTVLCQVQLKADQKALLAGFKRTMPVLCLAGAWCGDCINQCPIFARFAAEFPGIQVRYLDRDEHADVQQELKICGGNRVPVLVFFTEDGQEIARYGDRTLSKYRDLMKQQAGASCPTGINVANDPLLDQVAQDWLDEFERVQWILRLSPRLRQKHGD